MKKFLVACLALLSANIVMAQPPNVPAEKGAKFGAEFTIQSAQPVSEMVKSLQGSEKKEIFIEGEVAQVCEKEGCWLKIKNGNQLVMVKMRDHGFLVPVAINGKRIAIKGDAQVKETSVAQLRHYAEDAGKSKEEIEKITTPKREVIINADGIQVL